MEPPDPFDPAGLRLDASMFGRTEAAAPRPVKPPRHRNGEWFLRGPVPWSWLEAAARLPGKALALSLCLWREAGRRGGRRTVKVCLSRVGLGMSEQAARRALQSLETANLVSVARKPGRGLELTLLDVPTDSAPPAGLIAGRGSCTAEGPSP
jgi:hypothetical protein